MLNDCGAGEYGLNRVFIDDCQRWLSSDHPRENGYDLIYIDPPYDTGTKFSYNDARQNWVEWMTPKISALDSSHR